MTLCDQYNHERPKKKESKNYFVDDIFGRANFSKRQDSKFLSHLPGRNKLVGGKKKRYFQIL